MFYGICGCMNDPEAAWLALISELAHCYPNLCLDCFVGSGIVLHNGIYTIADLMDGVKREDEIMHARLLGYEGMADDRKIETLDEFMNSNCSCAVICTDWTEFEVYAKRRDRIKAAESALLRCGAENILYIDETNYGRDSFLVY